MRISDNCWRHTLPKKQFLFRSSAVRYAKQLARERSKYLPEDCGFSVSTHRDGVEYVRIMCDKSKLFKLENEN